MIDHRRLDDRPQPLVCMCAVPVPEHIVLFDAWQCSRCLRKLRYTLKSGSTHE